MTGGVSSTSTSPAIRPAPGSSSSYEKRFPYQSAPKYLIFDHDAKYGLEVPAAIQFMKITRIQTSFQSPWQNGVAERWVGRYRRELLHQDLAVNEHQLR